MKTFAQLSDKEIRSVVEYFKLIKWDKNPFIAEKTYPFGMPDYPCAICMSYAFNEKGEVYEMDAKSRPTYMASDLPPIPAGELNVVADLKRLELFEKENGKIEFNA